MPFCLGNGFSQLGVEQFAVFSCFRRQLLPGIITASPTPPRFFPLENILDSVNPFCDIKYARQCFLITFLILLVEELLAVGDYVFGR